MDNTRERHLRILREHRRRFVELYGEKDRSVEFLDGVIRRIEKGGDSVEALSSLGDRPDCGDVEMI